MESFTDLNTIVAAAINPALALLPAVMDTPAARVMVNSQMDQAACQGVLKFLRGAPLRRFPRLGNR
ncbi:hypothetical protein [Achromobacter xylosoxidans]|uniref:hypothetical protein n=1 Tax=Alcaligenes xylosoxydans xylosoxydans TaxID=85698 RepID=UPI0010613A3B|nr:hypothetical protein [Achromobacter xylosoxidans]